ncbi:class I SAM-dependent methyltransferase [Egicoccus sp. AB-alg6-2]|uniref:class I SAM-dependent methyltransferase n=1 Tax=Egicoccus sp. AB-alg6-2 TaxID=3242692 RepID=UPI00359E360D
MNSVVQRVFAAVYDPMLARVERRGLAELRRHLLGSIDGEVVEIGAGTGANLEHYGDRVRRVVAVEPSPPMADRARRRRLVGKLDVEVVVAPAERLPLADASVDVAVSTLVLCSVRDVAASLAEVHRVLRPGGRFVLLEHVAGEDGMLRLQRFVQPVWKPLAGGCHLTRDPLPSLRAAGFDVADLRHVRLPLPGPASPGLVGTATRL